MVFDNNITTTSRVSSLVADFDEDMAHAREMAHSRNYHRKSPSMMMIVVPLVEDASNATVIRDDLNASFYDYFEDQHQEQQSYDHDNVSTGLDAAEEQQATKNNHRIESPRSIMQDLFQFSFLGEEEELLQEVEQIPHSTTTKRTTSLSVPIPALTDLIKSTTISTARKLCHKRSRNRAMTAIEFERCIFPRLYDEESDDDDDDDDTQSGYFHQEEQCNSPQGVTITSSDGLDVEKCTPQEKDKESIWC